MLLYFPADDSTFRAKYKILVGFGRACAPVRCAHPSFWAHWHAKQGAARPPPPLAHRSFAASHSTPKNIKNLSNLGRPRQRLFSFHLTTWRLKRLWNMRSPFILFLYSSWIFSFCYSLLFLLSFLFPAYSSFLILLFWSLLSLLVGTILRLLIILNCLLYYRHNISVILKDCSRGPSLFWSIWGQN